MPKIYRSMLEDNGKPKIGPTATGLGGRVGTEKPDITLDANGQVYPSQGGMSVSPTLTGLPLHRIPMGLKSQVPLATGKDTLVVWSYGEGDFVASGLTAELAFRPDPDNPFKHGFVEPATEMHIDTFQQALAATQQDWKRDEV